MIFLKVRKQLYDNFITDFTNSVCNLKGEFSNYVFLCIGTDRMTGDSFGPLVGYKLKALLEGDYRNVSIVGTLAEPVSCINAYSKVKKIYEKYPRPCIIAIDAALSRQEDVGNLIVSNKKIKLGNGLDKKCYTIGDVSIKGVVAPNYSEPKCNFRVLQNTSLNLVMDLADVTANGIYNVINEIN